MSNVPGNKSLLVLLGLVFVGYVSGILPYKDSGVILLLLLALIMMSDSDGNITEEAEQ